MANHNGLIYLSVPLHDTYLWPVDVPEGVNYPDKELNPTDTTGITPVQFLAVGDHTSIRTDNARKDASVGIELEYFKHDFYDRAHVVPSFVNVGKVLNELTVSLYVWSAYFTSQTVNAVEEEGTEGLTLSYPDDWSNFAAMEGKFFSVAVSASGPLVIDATFAFDFSTSKPALNIIGDRGVYVWPFRPTEAVTEALEWKTDVIPSYDNEERISLRKYPRKSISMESYLLDDPALIKAKTLAEHWVSYSFAIPVWSELSSHKFLNSGITQIDVDTSLAKYVEGDSLIIWQSYDNHETGTIESVDENQVILSGGTMNSYTNCVVMPVNIGRAFTGIDFDVEVGTTPVNKVSVKFTSLQNQGYEDDVFPSYDGLQVMNDPSTSTSNLSEKVIHSTELVDFETGKIATYRKERRSRLNQMVSWVALNRQSLWKIKNFIYGVKGKFTSFLLPSFKNDIIITSEIVLSDTSIVIEEVGFYRSNEPFYIFMKLVNGSEIYRKVVGSFLSSEEGFEVLQVQEGFDADFSPADFKRISVMKRVRLDSDRIEFKYDNEITHVQVPTTMVNINE